jgi:transposase InsO family protein
MSGARHASAGDRARLTQLAQSSSAAVFATPTHQQASRACDANGAPLLSVGLRAQPRAITQLLQEAMPSSAIAHGTQLLPTEIVRLRDALGPRGVELIVSDGSGAMNDMPMQCMWYTTQKHDVLARYIAAHGTIGHLHADMTFQVVAGSMNLVTLLMYDADRGRYAPLLQALVECHSTGGSLDTIGWCRFWLQCFIRFPELIDHGFLLVDRLVLDFEMAERYGFFIAFAAITRSRSPNPAASRYEADIELQNNITRGAFPCRRPFSSLVGEERDFYRELIAEGHERVAHAVVGCDFHLIDNFNRAAQSYDLENATQRVLHEQLRGQLALLRCRDVSANTPLSPQAAQQIIRHIIDNSHLHPQPVSNWITTNVVPNDTAAMWVGPFGQRDDDGILRMIYAGGRATADYERCYGPMDLEGVAVILAFKNAPHMLDNGLPVRVLTDSRPLVDFFTNATPISDPAYAPVRARLVAALQGFNISWHHVEGEQNAFMDAASRAAWTPTSGLEQSGPDTQAHTLLPPSAQAPARVAMIRPFSPSGQTPDVSEEDDTFDGDDDAEDDDDYVSVASDEPEGDELDLRAAEHQGGDAHDPIMISSDSEPSTPRTTGDDASVDNGVLQSLESSSVEVNAASITDDASVDSAVSEPSAEAAAPVFSSLPLLHDESLPPGTDIEIESNFALDRRAMAEAQRSDRSLNALFAHAHGITQKSNKVKKRNPSIDIDGRLFVLHGQQRAAVLVVPAELVPREINAAHERIGHRGADATLKELQLTQWWPGMEEQVRTWCDRCPICQTRLKAQRATPDLAQHPRAARFDAVHMDLMPMPSSSTGNKYALVVVDRTSGAAIATPMRSKSTNDILDAYQREWVDVYGSPKTLHPDDALELNSKAVRAMCTRHGTSLVASAPYNKQANGLAERFIQTIKRALSARLHGRDVGSWDKELSSVVASYMTTAQAVRGGVSPFELTYGQAPVSQEARVLRVVPLRPAAKQRVDELVPCRHP